jgi:hypothetical protein
LPLQETHEWEDPPGTDIQAYDPQAAAARLGVPGEVDYYALLEVSRDADAATIKQQYYILARKWHPGGGRGCGREDSRQCTAASSSWSVGQADSMWVHRAFAAAGLHWFAAGTQAGHHQQAGSQLTEQLLTICVTVSADKNPDNAEATERFQQLGQAYQVSSFSFSWGWLLLLGERWQPAACCRSRPDEARRPGSHISLQRGCRPYVAAARREPQAPAPHCRRWYCCCCFCFR